MGKRRSYQERIQAHLEEIEKLKELERQSNRKTEGLKKAKSVLRALHKAIEVAEEEDDTELTKALQKAAGIIGGALDGSPVSSGRVRRTKEEIEAQKEELRAGLLRFLEVNSEISMGDICDALNQEAKDVRPALMSLLEDKLVSKEGERRGTRYSITQKGRKKVA